MGVAGQVRDNLLATGLLPGRVVLAACSGGPDSVTLAHCLGRLAGTMGFSLSLACFDHAIRPESAAEAALVGRLARDWDLPFATARAETPPRGQEAARKLRHEFLERIRRRIGADLIALGHNADDQAETVLMRIIRGSGPDGLAAMPLTDGRLIRPLLTVGRAEIYDYLRRRNLPFAEDPSNRSPKYLRSRIRGRILPDLARENPNIKPALTGMAELVGRDNDLLNRLAAEALDRLRLDRRDGVALDRPGLIELHPALLGRVIRLALDQARGDLRRIDQGHVNEVSRLLSKGRSGAGLDLPGRTTVRRSAEAIFFFGPARPIPTALERLIIPGPGRYVLSTGAALTVTVAPAPEVFRPDPLTAWLDPDRAPFPWIVRPVEPGDRLEPVGLDGSKKAADLMSEAGLAAHERRLLPVIAADRIILWLAGLRLGRTALARSGRGGAMKTMYDPGVYRLD